VFLIAFLWIEQTGRCDELTQHCNNNSECIELIKKAESERETAEIDSRQGDSQKGHGHYSLAAKLYHSAYKIEANPEFLFRTCTLVDQANAGTDKCASKHCYRKLLKFHSNASVVQNFKDTIDLSLASCTRQEAEKSVPLVDWSKSLKPGFYGPIYLKDGEKPWLEYVAQVEAEHTERIKKQFPHHYRTRLAGTVLMGIGLAGAIGSGFAALTGLSSCLYGCTVNSPKEILSNNLWNIGGKVAAGSFGLFCAAIVIWGSPKFSKKYSKHQILTIPTYSRSGYASVPE
jgi:hypothetical protein